MNIDDKLLSKLEKLSALRISDDKREDTMSNLSEIVSFVENLNELDLSAFEATVSTIDTCTPFREDLSKQSDVIDCVLKHAPSHDESFFLVPKVIE